MTTTKALSQADLRQFYGSEHWYRHALNRDVLYTDGAKYVADEGDAYWLLDMIALFQRSEKRVAAATFQVWTLSVRPDCTATLTCDDGNLDRVLEHAIEYTDFPAAEVTLWFSDGVIYLPSER